LGGECRDLGDLFKQPLSTSFPLVLLKSVFLSQIKPVAIFRIVLRIVLRIAMLYKHGAFEL
jgi:hypothetical protein